MKIKTERLLLETVTKPMLTSLLKTGQYNELILKSKIDPDVIKLINDDLKKYKRNNHLMIWSIWFVIKDNEIIGNVGFKNMPFSSVEIAYGIFDGYRLNGYAFEAVGALMAFAKSEGVDTFLAECDVQNNQSIKLLEKMSFELIRETDKMKYWQKKIAL